MIVDDDDVTLRLKRLANELGEKGRLHDPEWRRAFLAVRRHVFVPRFWHDDEPGAFPARWRMIDHATVHHPEWLNAVYSDRTLATELTGVPARDAPGMHPQVTSSTTMPSLVVAMLESLDVRDGMRVLEIGTGTGYNAALLAERVGDTHVTTIDIGPEITALARLRLAAHGYRPHVVTGDGAAGVADRAPFDRIVATCGLDHVPQAWIDQTNDGGKILVNLLGPWNQFALLLLTVRGDRASGPFLAQTGGFMPRRTDAERAHDYATNIVRAPHANVDFRRTALDPHTLDTDPAVGLLMQFGFPDVVARQVYVDGSEQLATEIATRDGSSWAVVRHARDGQRGFPVSQAGTRRLWDEIENRHRAWLDRDRPGPHRFGLTVGGGKVPRLWLDKPTG